MFDQSVLSYITMAFHWVIIGTDENYFWHLANYVINVGYLDSVVI